MQRIKAIDGSSFILMDTVSAMLCHVIRTDINRICKIQRYLLSPSLAVGRNEWIMEVPVLWCLLIRFHQRAAGWLPETPLLATTAPLAYCGLMARCQNLARLLMIKALAFIVRYRSPGADPPDWYVG